MLQEDCNLYSGTQWCIFGHYNIRPECIVLAEIILNKVSAYSGYPVIEY